jgi:hypothetical protein
MFDTVGQLLRIELHPHLARPRRADARVIVLFGAPTTMLPNVSTCDDPARIARTLCAGSIDHAATRLAVRMNERARNRFGHSHLIRWRGAVVWTTLVKRSAGPAVAWAVML